MANTKSLAVNIVRGGIVLGALGVLGGQAQAGGIIIPGYGSQAQPRAGAMTAKADDPSALFHNPAGMAKLSGTIIQLGVNLVNFTQKFTREGSYDDIPDGLPYAGQPYETVENASHGAVAIGDFAVVPLFAAVSDLGLDLPMTFGFGVFVPGSASVDRDYVDGYELEADPTRPPPPGRYDILKQEALVVLPSIGAAYRVSEQFSLGARLSWGFAHLKASSTTWGSRNYEEYEGFDTTFSLDVKDNFVPAFDIGALYKPKENIELGFNYRSAININAKGDGFVAVGSALTEVTMGASPLGPWDGGPNGIFNCGPGSDVFAFTTCANFSLPQMATLGGRWIAYDGKGGERADVELDVQWEDWSSASDLTIKVDAQAITSTSPLPDSVIRHGFKDVFSFRLGGSYTLPVGEHSLNVRAGAAYDTETAPESFTRLDQDGFARTTLATGIGYDLPGWRFELSGGAVLEGTRDVSHGGCNPTVDSPGCDGTGLETPVADRDAPDPAQPIKEPNAQDQSPFNAGTYEQGYLFFGFGVTASF